MLRDVDDGLIIYAGMGPVSDVDWPGASLLVSDDGGITFPRVIATWAPDQASEWGLTKTALGDAPIGDQPELLEGAPVAAFREKLAREQRLLGINFRMVHARLYEGIGLAYRDLGDWNRAAGNLEKSLEILGSGVTTLEHLAFSYRQAGDLAASAEALERALAIAEVFEIRYDLAATYLELEQARQAFETLSAAPERDPGLNREQQADFHFGLGWILFSGLSRQEEARRHFERFLELAPDDPQGLEIRRILETPGDEPG